LFNCSFISDVRTCLKLKQFLKQFRRVGKYANAAETVSECYFSFISPCETDALQTTVEMLVSVRRAAAARALAERRDEGVAGHRHSLLPVPVSHDRHRWIRSEAGEHVTRVGHVVDHVVVRGHSPSLGPEVRSRSGHTENNAP